MSNWLPSLHRLFIGHMVSSVAVVHTLQQRRSGPVDSVANMFSRMCGRTMFLYCIPAVLWLIDAGIARKLIAAWAVGFYVASCMRDLLCMPRLEQVSDHVDVLRPDGTAVEFGLPCVKSFSATLFPILLAYLYWQQHQSSYFMGALLSSCWIFSVLSSRVYLGVASLAAVTAGAIIAVGTTGLWILIGDAVDNVLVVQQSWIVYAQPLGCLVALLAYPVPWRHTTTFQTAAGVLGMSSGFLFGSSLTFSGWLPKALILTGIMVTMLCKAVIDRTLKTSQFSLAWLVPRLSPHHQPLLPCMYSYDDFAFPMMSLWSSRPPTLRVRLDVGPAANDAVVGGNPHGTSLNSSVGSSTSPPDFAASKFRKRKQSKGGDVLPSNNNAAASVNNTNNSNASNATPYTNGLTHSNNGVNKCSGSGSGGPLAPRLPPVHHGTPSTWYSVPLHTAFQRMLKGTTPSTTPTAGGSGLTNVLPQLMALFGPFASLATHQSLVTSALSGFTQGGDTGCVEADIMPVELHHATISSTAPLFQADYRRYARVIPFTALSHFVAGVVSAVLAPSCMYSLMI